MSALTDAREALEAAKATHQAAVVAESAARSDAETLRTRIANGDTKVKPADLTEADAKVEHARMVAVGAERPIAELDQAVREAQIDEVCDSVSTRVPQLGTAVREALEDLADALPPLVAAARAYDGFVDESSRLIGWSPHDLSARVTTSRFSAPTIDKRPLQECRGASQLAAILVPAMVALGAPSGFVESLKHMAAGAPNLPTI